MWLWEPTLNICTQRKGFDTGLSSFKDEHLNDKGDILIGALFLVASYCNKCPVPQQWHKEDIFTECIWSDVDFKTRQTVLVKLFLPIDYEKGTEVVSFGQVDSHRYLEVLPSLPIDGIR